MNKVALIILLLIQTATHAQINCTIKLVDSYSYNTVQLNNSIQIKNAEFSLDTINNLITVHKIKGNHLEISFLNYEDHTEKVKLRKYKNDTITRQLIPVDSVIQSRFDRIWKPSHPNSDTLLFENSTELKKHVYGYLKYLEILNEVCDNGMCNYANFYRYKISFVETNSVFEVDAVQKLQPIEYNCDELDKYLNQLKIIYPKFRIKEPENKNIEFYFTLKL
jgi:hypothetical protein